MPYTVEKVFDVLLILCYATIKGTIFAVNAARSIPENTAFQDEITSDTFSDVHSVTYSHPMVYTVLTDVFL